MAIDEIKSTTLSKHLFWDIDINSLDLEKHKKQIIHRVLDYGLIDDWQFIYNYYGISEIAKTAITIRDLERKSASFIALLANIPKEKFLCYTTTQSTPQHWNF
jgi:hypothetical protein